jgi:hypothetical protein
MDRSIFMFEFWVLDEIQFIKKKKKKKARLYSMIW